MLRNPSKGALLFGPPLTGKTLIAKAITAESRLTFFNVSPSNILDMWFGNSERLGETLFAVTRKATECDIY